MKQLISVCIVSTIVVFVLVVYLTIPSTINKSTEVSIHSAQNPAREYLLDEKKWVAWWPTDTTTRKSVPAGSFYYNGYSFRIGNKYLSGVEVISEHAGDSIKGLISLIPWGKDSVKFIWEYQLKTSLNPFTRIAQNRKAISLKEDMVFILQQLASFLSDEQNIYGIKVNHTTVTDTLLVTTKSVFNHEPDVASIYQLIDLLQQYVSQTGATATNPPMLHIKRMDSTRVEVMVAVPVNKVLDNAGPIAFKRMVAGNILYTEVQGGPATVQRAFRELENYLSDHRYESPAIPFESLVTNRLQQPDTTRWVTRIYYPVF